jgi:para-nitrobenzyl esterase
VPIIHGSNHDEGRFFIPLTPQLGTLQADGGFTDNLVPDTLPGEVRYTYALSTLFGFPQNVVAQVVAKYPGGRTDASANAALAAVATDLAFACPAVTVDTLAARQGVAVYAYEFNDASAPANYFGRITMQDGKNFPFAAAHTAEIQYVFPISNPSPVGFQLPQIQMNQTQFEISATMVNYWTKFAATGNPNPGSSNLWPSFPAGPAATPQWRSFGTQQKVINTFGSDHNCAFWQRFGG